MRHALLRSLAGLAVLSSAAPLALAQGSATYRVTFDASWSAATHPTAFPGGAHFSPLIGAVHSGAVKFWTAGGIASAGIEQMAETGSTFALTTEVNAAIAAGTALGQVSGGGVGVSPGSVSTTFTATTDFPLLSLVTMIAPSPDWFVGIHDQPLLVGGTWVDNVTLPLFAYDAGTDSGSGFTSPNQNTNPQQPIALQSGGPFTGATPLGTFRIERIDSTLVFGLVNAAGSLVHVGGAPLLGASVMLALDDPTGQFGSPLPTLLAISGSPQPNFPNGLVLPGFGLGPVGTPGEVLVGNGFFILAGPLFTGTAVTTSIAIPDQSSLAGALLYVQGVLVDPVQLRAGLTQAIELKLGS